MDYFDEWKIIIEAGWRLLKARCRCTFCGYLLDFDEDGDRLFPHYKCANRDCPESFEYKTGGSIINLLITLGGMTELESMTRQERLEYLKKG